MSDVQHSFVQIMTVLWEKETVTNLSHFTNKKLNIYQTFTRSVTALQFLVYRLLFKSFCLLSFFPKDSVSLLLASFSFFVGWPLGRHRRKYFWNLGLQIAVNCVFLAFFWSFRVSWGSFEIKFTRKMNTTFPYACLYLNKRVSWIGE